MIKGTTASGFAFKIDESVLMDMEFIELAAEAADNGLVLPKLLSFILGDTQKKKLYDHVRTKAGRVPADAVNKEVEDILSAIRENKETKN